MITVLIQVLGIIFYGSYVKGTYTKWSDIDLHIITCAKKSNRGRLVLDGYIVEYLERDIDSIKVEIEIDKAKNRLAYLSMLANGKIITGKRSDLFEATSAAIINALKYYAKIPDDLLLLSISVITPIQNLKKNYLNKDFQRLTLDEVLFALAITAQNNTMAEKALLQIPKLASAQMHSSIMLPSDEVSVLKKLKIDVTTETSQDTLLLN